MVIGVTTHNEILDIVKTLKNKKYTDCYGIDMKLVKKDYTIYSANFHIHL